METHSLPLLQTFKKIQEWGGEELTKKTFEGVKSAKEKGEKYVTELIEKIAKTVDAVLAYLPIDHQLPKETGESLREYGGGWWLSDDETAHTEYQAYEVFKDPVRIYNVKGKDVCYEETEDERAQRLKDFEEAKIRSKIKETLVREITAVLSTAA